MMPIKKKLSLCCLVTMLGIVCAVPAAFGSAETSKGASSGVTIRSQADDVLDYVAAVDLSIEAVVGLKPWDEKIAQRLDKQFQDLIAKGETFERKGGRRRWMPVLSWG